MTDTTDTTDTTDLAAEMAEEILELAGLTGELDYWKSLLMTRWGGSYTDEIWAAAREIVHERRALDDGEVL